jgi:hypothetical protein
LKKPLGIAFIAFIVCLAWPSEPVLAAEDLNPPLLLPWQNGQDWRTGIDGFHPSPGVDALDVFPPDTPTGGTFRCQGDPGWTAQESAYWIVAAAAGTVTQASADTVKIDHGNGWVTGYYHVHSFQVAVGDRVPPKWALGHPSNYGGCATGAHVHFWAAGPNSKDLTDVRISNRDATSIGTNQHIMDTGNNPPPTDTDGDGIPDSADNCDNDPEDFDGYQDADGCPEVNRMLGIVKSSGEFIAKEGTLDAGWVLESSGVAAAAMNGYRLSIVGNNGDLVAKDGIFGGWVPLEGLATQTHLNRDRIAMRRANGDALVKDGMFGGWVTVFGLANEVVVAGGRIGILQQDGSVYAKDNIGDGWTLLITDARSVGLDGDRIGVVLNDGTLIAKEGLNGGWVTLQGNVISASFGGNKVLAVLADGTLQGKDGIGGEWVTLDTNICSAAVAGDWIISLTMNGAVLAKETLFGGWIVEEGAGKQVLVGWEGQSSSSSPIDEDCDHITVAIDNCDSLPNASQANTDANFIDQTPPSTQDDSTHPNSDAAGDACDTDDDNDGLPDADEATGAACGGIITDPLLRDTDGDRILDGRECVRGTNPTSAASKPTVAQCGPNIDTDGDRLKDYVEVCAYNTNPNDTDTDEDQDGSPAGLTKDGCEAASLNNDRVVNSGDQLLIALEIAREIDQTLRLVSMDINKDGGVNSGDQLLMVGFITVLGSCP